jgi:hypothetical protein
MRPLYGTLISRLQNSTEKKRRETSTRCNKKIDPIAVQKEEEENEKIEGTTSNGTRFASPIRYNMLSNSWINCGSIDSLAACTRAGRYSAVARGAARSGKSARRSSSGIRALFFYGDTLLEAAPHALVPWIITWDDNHEVAKRPRGRRCVRAGR